MYKKVLSLLLVLIILAGVLSLTGCKGKPIDLRGDIKITGPDGELIIDSEMVINKKNATAADAIIQECSERRIAFTYEDGMFDNFEGIASTKEDGWILYSDKELAAVGAGELLLEDYFDIEFRYVNYNESFYGNGENSDGDKAKEDKSEVISGKVYITDNIGDIRLIDEDVSVDKENATAADIIIMLCEKYKFAYTYENGMFDNFDGLASTKEDGWLLYLNGKLATVGAGELLPEDDFIIEFRYVNYDESFNLQ